MFTIVLLCQFGISMEMLKRKIKNTADKKGINCIVDAYSFSTIQEVVEVADIILLGPQIGIKKTELEKDYAYTGTLFEVIKSSDYKMMNGGCILDSAINALGKG